MREEHDGYRHQRLTQLILEELESIFATELSDPRLQTVRVSTVALSVDYRSARILYITSNAHVEEHAELEKIERGFAKAASFLRRRVSEALDLKRSIELHFVYDREASAQVRATRTLDNK